METYLIHISKPLLDHPSFCEIFLISETGFKLNAPWFCSRAQTLLQSFKILLSMCRAHLAWKYYHCIGELYSLNLRKKFLAWFSKWFWTWIPSQSSSVDLLVNIHRVVVCVCVCVCMCLCVYVHCVYESAFVSWRNKQCALKCVSIYKMNCRLLPSLVMHRIFHSIYVDFLLDYVKYFRCDRIRYSIFRVM